MVIYDFRTMREPHDGRLVDRMVEGEHAESIQDSLDDTTIRLDAATFQDAVNIACGRYSPLTGFMTQSDFLKVAEDMTLEDGTVWPLPIVLDVDGEKAASLAPGRRAGLEAPDGSLVGCLDIDEVYTYNDERSARSIYGTDDDAHPGVASLYEKDQFFVGGDITLFDLHRHHGVDLFPAETRVLFEHNDWTTVAGFQTRNAPHRGHEYIQKSALELVDGLLIQPKLGDKKTNDYRDDIIIEAYRTLIDEYYPAGNVAMSAFPSTMRYAGPREAVFDALVRKNHGCTHFIVGRDHAGVGDYYHEMAAQHVFDGLPDIGIDILFYDYAFYCHECDGMASAKTCPHGEDAHEYPSGSRMRELITDGTIPSDKLMRPEVATYVRDSDEPFITAGLGASE
jgi:sulfate adenylyltransferase